ncbi:MAG: ABC transporter ATP-binding protein [Myxococcaceae bacterium]|nr:MAG: ABC transporter ATP-binding protein [Myxococcaceae bacterium]
MTAAPIECRNLSKEYRLGFLMNRRVLALQELSLDVRPGEVYGLLGPNGAGKSTTIKILLDLVKPSSGTATLFGRVPGDRHGRRDVSFVPENPAPYEYLTGREFVTLAGRLSGVPSTEVARRVGEVLGAVEMQDAADLHIRRYSKGMVQRIVIAQALVHRPRLLILDEPTSGLDPLGRKLVRELILAERRAGTTILFCTHIIADVEAVCDRVGVLVAGRMRTEGSVSELLAQQKSSFEVVLEDFSIESVNALGLPVEDVDSLGGHTLVRVAEPELPHLLQQAIQRGARVRSVEPQRASLETLFVDTIQRASSKRRVGGEMVA